MCLDNWRRVEGQEEAVGVAYKAIRVALNGELTSVYSPSEVKFHPTEWQPSAVRLVGEAAYLFSDVPADYPIGYHCTKKIDRRHAPRVFKIEYRGILAEGIDCFLGQDPTSVSPDALIIKTFRILEEVAWWLSGSAPGVESK